MVGETGSYIVVGLRRQNGSAVQAVVKVELLNHVGHVTNDLRAVHGSGETTDDIISNYVDSSMGILRAILTQERS